MEQITAVGRARHNQIVVGCRRILGLARAEKPELIWVAVAAESCASVQ